MLSPKVTLEMTEPDIYCVVFAKVLRFSLLACWRSVYHSYDEKMLPSSIVCGFFFHNTPFTMIIFTQFMITSDLEWLHAYMLYTN